MTSKDQILLNDWHVIAKSEDLHQDKLISAKLLGENLALWRSGERVLAFQDRCSHRGAKLSKGWIDAQGLLTCPYHGVTFNPEGYCQRIPAHPNLRVTSPSSRITTYPTQERYGFIWVCLGEPKQDIPNFPERIDPCFKTFLCGPYRFCTSALRVVENFFDSGHFPFVHSGLLGDLHYPEIPDYSVTLEENGIVAHDIQCYQPDPEGTGEGKTVSYIYRIERPLIVYSRKLSTDAYFSTVLLITPVDEVECIAWYNVARNFAFDTPDAELQAFQNHLMSQDIPIVEAQSPQKLPLEMQAEFHFPMDKLSVAYRKWLKQMGLTFGVC